MANNSKVDWKAGDRILSPDGRRYFVREQAIDSGLILIGADNQPCVAAGTQAAFELTGWRWLGNALPEATPGEDSGLQAIPEI